MLNKAQLIGYLGKDPELRFTNAGTGKCTFSIVTTKKWTDNATGEKKERTNWHNIVVWGKHGEVCQQYLAKGRQVYVEGEIETRSYDDKEGNKRWVTEIIAKEVLFLGSAGNQEQGRRGAAAALVGEDSQPDDDSIPF